MKNYQYYGLLGAIFIAPIPSESWTANIVIGFALIVGSMWYSFKNE